MSMKLIHMLSVGVATVGMTCLVGYASAANTASGDLIPDSMLVAQGTAAPGGKGGGSIGEPGRGDKGSIRGEKGFSGNSGSINPGTGTDGTFPEKAKPGMGMDTGPGGNIGSNSGRTGASSGSSGSSTEPSGDTGLSGMKGIGSGSSSGTGGAGK
jgi:hypothetical protein